MLPCFILPFPCLCITYFDHIYPLLSSLVPFLLLLIAKGQALCLTHTEEEWKTPPINTKRQLLLCVTCVFLGYNSYIDEEFFYKDINNYVLPYHKPVLIVLNNRFNHDIVKHVWTVVTLITLLFLPLLLLSLLSPAGPPPTFSSFLVYGMTW